MLNYIIDEANRTVMAQLSEVIRIESPSNKLIKSPKTFYFTGKAICHKDDKWDVEIGKAIARTRVLIKHNRWKRSLTKTRIDKLNQEMNEVYKNINKLDKYNIKLIARLNSLAK